MSIELGTKLVDLEAGGILQKLKMAEDCFNMMQARNKMTSLREKKHFSHGTQRQKMQPQL